MSPAYRFIEPGEEEDDGDVGVTKFDFLNQVSFSVGKQEAVFHIPKTLIRWRSNFFEAACSERWTRLRGDNGDPIRLPDDEPEIFSLYLQLLYTGDVVLDEKLITAIADINKVPDWMPLHIIHHYNQQWMKIAKLYVLIDKIGDTKANHDVMKEIYRRCAYWGLKAFERPSIEVIHYVSDHTLDDATIRRLLIDQAAANMDQGQIDAWIGTAPNEILLPVMEKLIALRENACSCSMSPRRISPARDYFDDYFD